MSFDFAVQRFVCRYWDAEDVWFYFELDAGGWVTRHVELHGPHRTPGVAVSLAEWMHELDAGRIQEYQKRYGVLAEKPLEADELCDWLPVTADEFEQVWAHARAHVEASLTFRASARQGMAG